MTDTLTTVRPARPAGRRAASPGAILAIVLTGQFMALLDASVVNVAAPAIHADLHASGAGLQLVIAGYVVTYAVLLVTGARLGDILGHRTVFLFGVALFTLASLGCGLAGSTDLLVALRFVQGAGAAAMIPQVLSLIQRSFPGPARASPACSGLIRSRRLRRKAASSARRCCPLAVVTTFMHPSCRGRQTVARCCWYQDNQAPGTRIRGTASSVT